MLKKNSVSETVSEICLILKEKFQNRSLNVIGFIASCLNTIMISALLKLITVKQYATLYTVFLFATTQIGTVVAAKICLQKMLSLSTLKMLRALITA